MISNSDPPFRHSARHRRGLWPLAASAAYLVVTVIVAAAEYVSEMSKIGRRTYTDTFSPFLFTKLLTLPMSAAHSAWTGYPVQFSTDAYRHTVRSAVPPTAINIVTTAALIFGIGLIWTWVRRRGHV